MNRSYSKIRHIQESNMILEDRRIIQKQINESLLLTLGGISLGVGIIKKAYDYISNRSLERDMEETGNTQEGSNGVVMKEYIEKSTGDVYWGVDVTDKTRDEGFQKRNVLLFRGDNTERIEKILNSEIIHGSDEDMMGDDYDSMFGQFKSDKRIYKGRE
jgi:hypothetical protein